MSLLPYHKGNKTKFTNLLFPLIPLTPDMLTHITPRGISALLGPVGKPTLLAPVGDKKNETYVFLTPDMLTHIKILILPCRL